MSRGPEWLTTEVAYLRAAYGVFEIRYMEYLLRRHSRSAIKQKAMSLGLKSSFARKKKEPAQPAGIGVPDRPEGHARQRAGRSVAGVAA